MSKQHTTPEIVKGSRRFHFTCDSTLLDRLNREVDRLNRAGLSVTASHLLRQYVVEGLERAEQTARKIGVTA